MLAGLSSLWHQDCKTLVKIWIFDDPIHKKWSVLVILVPGRIQSSRQAVFWGKKGFGGRWVIEVAEAAEVNEAVKVSKAVKITTEVFRVLGFNN